TIAITAPFITCVTTGWVLGTTVTVTCLVTVPPGPLAVSVYVVVDCGVTCTLVIVAGKIPKFWSSATSMAPVTDQLSVALVPRSMEAGVALNCETTGGGGVTRPGTVILNIWSFPG